MKVQIDPSAGFCFGVANAIQKSEMQISRSGSLLCLGEIVHNPSELKRLKDMGLSTIEASEFENHKNETILFRAHGEPPESYRKAEKEHMTVIDATCPIVLKLQERIQKACKKADERNGQVILFGKKNHPEILGLIGHSKGKTKLVSSPEDLSDLDLSKPVFLFSQTTANPYEFDQLIAVIKENMSAHFPAEDPPLEVHHSICKKVTGRVPVLEKFAKENDVIVFVGGKKSSNGRFLYEICKKNNPNSYMIEDEGDIDHSWFSNTKTIGISGATSTPLWLLEKIAAQLLTI
jgi:4-hydroxy-3-methylbut-2-en-1-yl diphosphate reductase